MSIPSEPEKVKLTCSIFSSDKLLIGRARSELEQKFGPVDWMSPELFFNRTRYYEREMGWPLHRRFVSFRQLIEPDHIVETKLETNSLENKYRQDGKRRVNIDPGYISLERLVLATGKNYTHRIYLSRGIYADLTLVFKKGSFRPLEWTYRDYAKPEIISFFNELRDKYKKQLRGVEEEEAPA